MKQLAVIGEEEFTLGFRLTGIRKIITTTDADKDVSELLADQGIGVVIIDQSTMDTLSSRVREEVLSSIAPVFVTVSEVAAQEELRKMILQSIGVDLLKN